MDLNADLMRLSNTIREQAMDAPSETQCQEMEKNAKRLSFRRAFLRGVYGGVFAFFAMAVLGAPLYAMWVAVIVIIALSFFLWKDPILGRYRDALFCERCKTPFALYIDEWDVDNPYKPHLVGGQTYVTADYSMIFKCMKCGAKFNKKKRSLDLS